MEKRNVQYIMPVVTGCIGGVAGAVIVGMLHAAASRYGSTCRWGMLIAGNSFLRYSLDMALAFVVAFFSSCFLYQWGGKKGFAEDKRHAGKASPAKQEKHTGQEMGIVYSPLHGQVVPMEEVPDDTFAAKVLGDGIAVVPSEGTVYAPFDGRVDKVYDAKHSISICSMDGIELLIHVGISTEELDGKFFELFVSDGDQVQKGDRLLEFDIEGMKEAGYSTVTPVVVTNSDDYGMIYPEGKGIVDGQDVLIRVSG